LRAAGFTVTLSGTGMETDDVVLCNQVRTLDLKARGGKYIEQAPDHIVDEVIGIVATLLE